MPCAPTRPNSQIFKNLTHKNIPDQQHSAKLRQISKPFHPIVYIVQLYWLDQTTVVRDAGAVPHEVRLGRSDNKTILLHLKGTVLRDNITFLFAQTLFMGP